MSKKFLLGCLMIFMCTSSLIGCIYKVKVKQTEAAEFSENINKISINSKSTDVKIILSNDDKINANLHGTASAEKSAPKLEVKVQNEEVNINIVYPNITIFGGSDIDLDVYIPEKYNKDLSIQTSSGNINIENIQLSNFTGELTSGDLKINDMIAEEILIETSSGKVTLGDLEASNFKRISSSGDSSIKNINSKEVSIESSSGKVQVDNIVADVLKGNSSSGDSYFKDVDSKEVEITTNSGKITFDKLLSNTTKSEASSGDIKIKKFKGDLFIERSSGKTEVQWIDFNNNVEINSTSGDVLLDLPEKAQFNIDFKGSSGEHDIDFPIKFVGEIEESEIEGSVGESKNLIKVHTSSGNLTINKR